MSTQLLKIVNSKTKLPLGAFLIFWVVLLYMLPQKYQYINAFNVPLTFIDEAIPLSPHWIWIYVSYYLYLAAAFLLAKEEKNSNQIFYSYLVSAVVSTIIFFIFPTTIARDNYPIGEISTWSAWLLSQIRITDASLNCAPSMHCAMSTMAACTFLREKTWYRWPAAFWSLFIFYSTMATKQHYFWDVVTGVLFGLLIFTFFIRANYIESTAFESENV
jgi:membrane-associated phospholipid phosphatase